MQHGTRSSSTQQCRYNGTQRYCDAIGLPRAGATRSPRGSCGPVGELQAWVRGAGASCICFLHLVHPLGQGQNCKMHPCWSGRESRVLRASPVGLISRPPPRASTAGALRGWAFHWITNWVPFTAPAHFALGATECEGTAVKRGSRLVSTRNPPHPTSIGIREKRRGAEWRWVFVRFCGREYLHMQANTAPTLRR